MSDGYEAIWRALSDPVRRTILDALREGPETTSSLCGRFEMTRFGVMKHLKVLEASQLVIVERRGRERWNYLNAVPLKQATDRWLTPFQLTWATRLTGLAEHLKEGVSRMAASSGCQLDVRFEVRLPASSHKVFASLTKDIGAWWVQPYRQAGAGSVLTLKPEIGEALVETGPDGHSVIWGHIEEVHVPDRLYLFGRFAVPGAVAGRVHFDLDVDPNGCVLKVAHMAVGNIDDDARTSFTAGWRDLLDVRLRKFLDEAAG